MSFKISYHSRIAIAKGALVGIITMAMYLLVVIVTTPNLPPLAALNAAIRVNYIIIFGLAVGVGTQTFLSSYSKNLGCRINKKREQVIGGSGSTVLSSFLSFFSLVPLGCCGTWLLLLSMLPSVFGSTLAVVLIEYSKPLSYLGLFIVLGLTAISAFSLRKELERKREIKLKRSTDSTYDNNEVEAGSYKANRID